MKLIRRFIYFFNYKLRLKSKLILSFSIIILLPMLLLSLFINNKVTKMFQSQLTHSSNLSFEQLTMTLDSTLYHYDTLLFSISQDEVYPNLLFKDKQNYSSNEQSADRRALEKNIFSYMMRSGTGTLKLFFRDDFYYFTNGQLFNNIKQIESEYWYQTLIKNYNKNRRSILLCPSSYMNQTAGTESQIISLARVIINPNNYREVIAVARVDFSEDLLQQALSNSNSIDGSLTYLINDDNVVITASNEAFMNQYQPSTTIKYTTNSQFDIFNEVTINNKKYLVRQSYVPKYHYNIITMIPFQNVTKRIYAISSTIAMLFIVLCIFAFILAALISTPITSRILKVVRHMKEIRSGNFELITSGEGEDEIGELIENYNYMAHELQTLIALQFENGKEIKNAELNVLQAQINPHFLYNTLDMINWLASKNMNNEIRTVVIALAKFYRLSLSKGLEEISIKDELMHITFYMQIQNMRYKDRIQFTIDVEQDLQHYKILKTTFQPIIENAIQHGIMEKEDNQGHIDVSARVIDNDIIFTIMDDGIGMSPEQLELILLDKIQTKYVDSTSGYGVTNVNKRMKLYYGNDYGLKYYSELGKGTLVEVKIPRRE